MNDKIKQRLIKLANLQTKSDEEDFSAYDYSGGNFDDAFSIGMEDGERFLAWEIVNELWPEELKNKNNE